jgi:nucleotide-binding universal stress UspA family protein
VVSAGSIPGRLAPTVRLQTEEASQMIQKVLVGTDTSTSADMAVQAAADLARVHDAELLVLYVRGPVQSADAANPKKAADPQAYLAQIATRFPGVRVRSWTEPGDPAERLCTVAADERVDTIVVGNKGVHGARWRVHESVPTMVVRHSPCSVFIVDTRKAR